MSCVDHTLLDALTFCSAVLQDLSSGALGALRSSFTAARPAALVALLTRSGTVLVEPIAACLALTLSIAGLAVSNSAPLTGLVSVAVVPAEGRAVAYALARGCEVVRGDAFYPGLADCFRVITCLAVGGATGLLSACVSVQYVVRGALLAGSSTVAGGTVGILTCIAACPVEARLLPLITLTAREGARIAPGVRAAGTPLNASYGWSETRCSCCSRLAGLLSIASSVPEVSLWTGLYTGSSSF